MLAAKRNRRKLPLTSGADVAIASCPGLRLVFLWDGCVSAKLVANKYASGLSDSDALLVSVRVLT